MEDCGESNAECCVFLVGVDRVCMFLEGFVAYIVGWFLMVPSLHVLCFHSENFS